MNQVPEPNQDFVAIDADSDHCLGLKSDGSIVAWGCHGDADFGQCNVPLPNAGFQAIAAGRAHSVGLKIDGSIVVWGAERDLPIPNTGYIAVTAGNGYGIAIRGYRDCNANGQSDYCDIFNDFVADVDGDEIPEECEPPLTLDMRPGACPNVVHVGGRGIIPAAIVGTRGVDVTQVDTKSLALRRADGVGGTVKPERGLRGPRITLIDLTTPPEESVCACDRLGPDGLDDLLFEFSLRDLIRKLELGVLRSGTSVEVVLEGLLLDGTPFQASDCILMSGSQPR